MHTTLLILVIISSLSAVTAITFSDRIIALLHIDDENDLLQLINNGSFLERFYMLLSGTTILLIPFLFLSGITRFYYYGCFLLLQVALSSIIKSKLLQPYGTKVIIIIATIELLMYSDIIRSLVVSLFVE